MAEPEYPGLRDCDSYLSGLIEGNREQRYRFIAWLGSVVSVFAILTWFAIGLLEQTPEVLQLVPLLALGVLVYIVKLYVDALLPKGMAGVLDEITGQIRSSDETDLWAVYMANIPLIRERIVMVLMGDVVVAVALVFIFLVSVPGIGILALAVGVLRLAVTSCLMVLFLWVFQPRVLVPHLSRMHALTEKLERAAQKSEKVKLLLFKVWRLEQVAGAVGKTLLYVPQIIALFIVFISFGASVWQSLRIALVFIALAFLGIFALRLWETVRDLLHENAAWAGLKRGILTGRYKTVVELLAAFRTEAERIIVGRAHPYTIPLNVLRKTHGLDAHEN